MSAAPPRIGLERRRFLFASWLLAALLILAMVIAATVCPIGWRPRLSSDPNQERFWAFFALGVAAKFAAPRRHLSLIACVVLAAVVTEAAQLWSPGRDARIPDAVIKALGAFTGVQTGYAFFKLRRVWETLSEARAQRKVLSRIPQA
ncbi:MAG: hypothetical protein ACXU82_02995 [Caulobacteraceae bacterium]